MRLRQWVLELFRWIGEGKIVILCLLGIAAAVALGFFTWRSEVSIRSAGYVLQLIGMMFAINGLLSIREHFQKPLLRQVFCNWLMRFPKWKRRAIFLKANIRASTVTGKARLEVWTPDNPDQTIEERIEGIVKNLERISDEQRNHAKSIDKLQDTIERDKKKNAKQIKKMQDENNSFLESLHTSDLITSLIGLVWLTVGITMSTLAPELHQLLKRLDI